ncbi:MAG: hypothetical protein LBT47_14295 [Deltaproteobacteria bacterium]|jgi:hypothetical protein|nr:hypothetical protein [Deltaproteobacteria bacterium]
MPNFAIKSSALTRILLTLTVLSAALFSGCGVFSDFARDNQFHIGSLGLQDFISPVKLKVGILPFRDEVGLGTPDAGPNLAVLMSERFAENSQLVLISPAEAARAFASTGFDPKVELTAEQAVELGRILNVNIIMDGAISQIDQYRQRVGWRHLVRFFTNQQTYLDAVLTLVAFDTSTGMVISARAGEGIYKVGKHESDPFNTDRGIPTPSQESIEEGLELAIDDAYYRTLDGLAYTPFKAIVVAHQGESVQIAYGKDVDLKKGLDFVALTHPETIVNKINVEYQIPGGAKARLEVSEVFDQTATLKIVEGNIEVGDFIQSWED